MGAKKSLVKNSKNYLISELFNKGLIFLTIPIFTRLLTPSEYGLISVFTSLIGIFTVFVGMNFHGAINRRYFEESNEFKEFLGTNILFLVLVNLIILVLAFLFRVKLEEIFGIDKNLFYMALVISSFNFFIQIKYLYLQAEQRSKSYLLLSVIQNFSLILVSLLWMFMLKENKYLGRVYSQLLITSLISVYIIFNLIKSSKFKLKKEHIKYSLLYGIPLIPHALSGIILAQFDRIMLNKIIGGLDVGLYSFAYNVGMIMNVVVMSLNKAWVPVFFKGLKEQKYDKIEKLSELNIKLIIFFSLFLIFFNREIIKIMANENYYGALKIVPIIIVSFVAVFLYTLYANYAFFRKKTGLISLFTIIAGLLNITLNYIYIPKYGYNAAAWTTLISYIALFVFHYLNTKVILKEKTMSFSIILKNLLYLLIGIMTYFLIEVSNLRFGELLKILVLFMIFLLLFFKDIKKFKKNRKA